MDEFMCPTAIEIVDFTTEDDMSQGHRGGTTRDGDHVQQATEDSSVKFNDTTPSPHASTRHQAAAADCQSEHGARERPNNSRNAGNHGPRGSSHVGV